MGRYFLILLLINIVVYTNCSKKPKSFLSKNLKKAFQSNNLQILGIAKLSKTKILVIKVNYKEKIGLFLLVVNKKNDLINVFEFDKSFTYNMKLSRLVFFTDNHFLIVLYKNFIVYNQLSDKFSIFKPISPYIGHVVIFKNKIYFSTEKTNNVIRKINLKDGKITEYSTKLRHPPFNSAFYIKNNKLFVRDYYSNKTYLVEDKRLVLKKVKISTKDKIKRLLRTPSKKEKEQLTLIVKDLVNN